MAIFYFTMNDHIKDYLKKRKKFEKNIEIVS